MKVFLFAISFCAVLLYACSLTPTSEKKDSQGTYLAYFTPFVLNDTIHLVPESGENLSLKGKPIPAKQIFINLDSTMLEKLDYAADSVDGTYMAGKRFSLDEQFEACMLHYQYSWFDFSFLLIHDKQANKLVDIWKVEEFYGGDGGQLIMESFIFQSATNVQWVKWESSHTIIPEADSVRRIVEYESSWSKWDEGTFIPLEGISNETIRLKFPQEFEW